MGLWVRWRLCRLFRGWDGGTVCDLSDEGEGFHYSPHVPALSLSLTLSHTLFLFVCVLACLISCFSIFGSVGILARRSENAAVMRYPWS